MNTYLIPVTESYGYHYNYFALVYAKDSKEAYQVAKKNTRHLFIRPFSM